jgi:uncharacterized protein (UPF0276 family)
MRTVGNQAKKIKAPIILHSGQLSTTGCSKVQYNLIRYSTSLLDRFHHSETTGHLHFSNGIKPCNIQNET